MPIDEVNIIYTGDCLERLKLLPDNSIDSIVTDPPYGISFMGKTWDYHIPDRAVWEECLRVLKPGGHLLSFGGARTHHRIWCSIEDAGFEIRDTIMWVYGSGFPKSHNVALAIDKLNGFPNRGRAIPAASTHFPSGRYAEGEEKLTSNPVEEYEAKSESSKPWVGWGTQLKPAFEPICLARKPLEGTVAQNVLKYGTGGLNIDGCRVPTDEVLTINRLETWSGFGQKKRPMYERITTHSKSAKAAKGNGIYGGYGSVETHQTRGQSLGRFPANIIHDGSNEVVTLLPEDAHGSAARFFYCAKASREEKDFGLEGKKKAIEGRDAGQDTRNVPHKTRTTPVSNPHPTVKPLELMRYLVRLVTPPNGIVLDPFLGSGTTAIAATLEGFRYIGIEQDREHVEVATGRVLAWKREPRGPAGRRGDLPGNKGGGRRGEPEAGIRR